MPFKPSSEDMKKYDLERFIEDKVALILLCESELDVLRADPEGARKANEELERTMICLEGTLPPEPSDARAYLDKCKKLVETPAKSLVEREMRAGAAFTLLNEMIKDEARFPQHVRSYVLREYSARLDKTYENDRPSEGEQILLSHHDRRWPLHIHPPKKIIRFEKVDEPTARFLLGDMNAIEEKVFFLPGPTMKDAPAFRVVEIVRSKKEMFWELLYDGTEFSIRVDETELKDLLTSSTYAVYE